MADIRIKKWIIQMEAIKAAWTNRRKVIEKMQIRLSRRERESSQSN
jgi:hypothetical protein